MSSITPIIAQADFTSVEATIDNLYTGLLGVVVSIVGLVAMWLSVKWYWTGGRGGPKSYFKETLGGGLAVIVGLTVFHQVAVLSVDLVEGFVNGITL